MQEESSRQEKLPNEAVPPSLSTIIYQFLMGLLEKSGSSNTQQGQAGQGLQQADPGEGVPAWGRGCSEMSFKTLNPNRSVVLPIKPHLLNWSCSLTRKKKSVKKVFWFFFLRELSASILEV